MKSLRLISLAILLFSSLQASAIIYLEEQGRVWDAHWEQRFSAWVSNEVGPTFFKELSPEYAKLDLDCADALYALKAYFSMVYGIDFRIKGGALTHRTHAFDHYADDQQRLLEFVRYIAEVSGTEDLAHSDTYSVSVRDVRPGDIYLYKRCNEGECTRHSYIIKNVNANGTFDVLYSTQARRDKGAALGRIKQEYLQNKPDNTGRDANHWGFRRFKNHAFHNVDHARHPGADFEQYEMARLLSEGEYFDWINSQTRRVRETADEKMNRHLQSLCYKLRDRAEVVIDARDYAASVGGRCMDFREFDTYSTPSRDEGILNYYQKAEQDYNEMLRTGYSRELSRTTHYLVEALFNPGRSKQEAYDLSNHCRIVIPGAYRLDMGSFYDALKSGRASSHPNDNTDRRWGFATGQPTQCKAFY